jgi:hypothetical protein
MNERVCYSEKFSLNLTEFGAAVTRALHITQNKRAVLRVIK